MLKAAIAGLKIGRIENINSFVQVVYLWASGIYHGMDTEFSNTFSKKMKIYYMVP